MRYIGFHGELTIWGQHVALSLVSADVVIGNELAAVVAPKGVSHRCALVRRALEQTPHKYKDPRSDHSSYTGDRVLSAQ